MEVLMSRDIDDLLRSFMPPPRPEPLTINAAELTALRIIVVSLVAAVAKDQELKDGVQAQLWVNSIAEIAADAAAGGEYKSSDGRNIEGFKEKVLENVIGILRSINFPKVEGSN
jgi:hypothetical protein